MASRQRRPSPQPIARRRLAPELFGFALFVCACGIAARQSGSGTPARSSLQSDTAGPEDSAHSGAGNAPGAFAAIQAYAVANAPGMQPVARRESAGEKIEIVRAGTKDTCVRVAFQAKAPVVARMLDSAGVVLASSSAPAIEGILGELGPVCIRRGESLGVDTDGSATAVRWVAMASEPIH